jgi:hypothetical protein
MVKSVLSHHLYDGAVTRRWGRHTFYIDCPIKEVVT